MADINITIQTEVRLLPGVGEKKAALLERLGIHTVGELISHFPRVYQHRGDICTIKEAPENEYKAYILTVGTEPSNVTVKNRITLTKFSAFDDTGRCGIVFFNSPYVKDIFRVGTVFRFWGKLAKSNGIPIMSAPAYEPVTDPEGKGINLSEFVPLYPLTEGLSQKFLTGLIKIALSMLKIDCIENDEAAANSVKLDSSVKALEIIPIEVEKKYGLCSHAYALRAIHNPESYQMLDRGRERIIFEELYVFALGISLLKQRRRTFEAPKMSLNSDIIEKFCSMLPFKLTRSQDRVINDIIRDMCSMQRIPMNRILIGDVGSGKTVCAAAAAYIAAVNGYQSAIMVPTEILAVQHYNDLEPLFSSLGMKTVLLTGSMKQSEKLDAREKTASEEVDIIIGTHALISGNTKFARLGLVITDEQHRFGIMQRAALSEKAWNAGTVGVNTLVMSATPIPRTLALTMFGDLNLSVIDELPPGRQKVDTFIVNESYRERLEGFIIKQKREGHQVYVVCPAVDGKNKVKNESAAEAGGTAIPYGLSGNQLEFDFLTSEVKKLPMKNAEDYAEELAAKYPELRVGVVHGRMNAEEKDKTMALFAAGDIDVLVSTTVIEVGVNVPNASLIVIENAERFGLSQLHQLRGRVGRGKCKSYCVLVSDSKAETAKKRLEIIKNNTDGYLIAKQDLELRGPGDFFVSLSGEYRQHGGVKFKYAELCANDEMLKNAFEEAENFIYSKSFEELLQSNAYSEVRRMFELNDSSLN